jgi:hypothetical protein
MSNQPVFRVKWMRFPSAGLIACLGQVMVQACVLLLHSLIVHCTWPEDPGLLHKQP